MKTKPLAILCCVLLNAAVHGSELSVTTKQVHLQGPFALHQLVVRRGTGPRDQDLTRQAAYQSTNPAIATVSEHGRISPVSNGTTDIRIDCDGSSLSVPVTVSAMDDAARPDFLHHVMPLLSKAGCNMGACHASQYGKGGFKLSVFGFEPAADHAAIVRDRHQRRISPLNPAESLLLKKPTMQVPHGGSRRLEKGSLGYRILAEWIRSGAPGPQREAVTVERIEVFPANRIAAPDDIQQLRVDAYYSDGTCRDVTAWARFDSMDEAVLDVNREGLVQVIGRGQAPVMVRYEGHAEVAMFVAPYGGPPKLADWKDNNFVDELAASKFRELGIQPSPLCDDATFLRRAWLDATGTLPDIDSTTEFLQSTDPEKRTRLVDRLLGLTGDPQLDIHNDAYAAWWTLKWSDLIRNNSNQTGEQGMWALHNWIRESFRTNKPYDQFVRELITARGSIYMNGPANYFRINRNSSDLAESTAQLFLGVRLQCAKCHHHPFEKYSQGDYNGFAAFFSRVGTKNSQEFGLFGRESVVLVRSPGNRKGTPLDGEPLGHPIDLRIPLAKWLTAPDNTYFASSVVNRYVSYLLGRGLVEPVDDMRATNPASNARLLQALSEEFVKSGYDLKQLMRTIMTSRLYQLDSQPLPGNKSDRRFFSHYKVKRLPAEALLDAIDRVTGVPTKFRNLPPGTRAIELPDAEYPNYFLTTFAKPRRASVCECERAPDENLAQALHTLNGDTLSVKMAHKQGLIARLLSEKQDAETIVRTLYLAALCRSPRDDELQTWTEFLKSSGQSAEACEDVLWTLINSKQFLFVH